MKIVIKSLIGWRGEFELPEDALVSDLYSDSIYADNNLYYKDKQIFGWQKLSEILSEDDLQKKEAGFFVKHIVYYYEREPLRYAKRVEILDSERFRQPMIHEIICQATRFKCCLFTQSRPNGKKDLYYIVKEGNGFSQSLIFHNIENINSYRNTHTISSIAKIPQYELSNLLSEVEYDTYVREKSCIPTLIKKGRDAKNLEIALENFTKAIILNPTHAEATSCLSESFLKMIRDNKITKNVIFLTVQNFLTLIGRLKADDQIGVIKTLMNSLDRLPLADLHSAARLRHTAVMRELFEKLQTIELERILNPTELSVVEVQGAASSSSDTAPSTRAKTVTGDRSRRTVFGLWDQTAKDAVVSTTQLEENEWEEDAKAMFRSGRFLHKTFSS